MLTYILPDKIPDIWYFCKEKQKKKGERIPVYSFQKCLKQETDTQFHVDTGIKKNNSGLMWGNDVLNSQRRTLVHPETCQLTLVKIKSLYVASHKIILKYILKMA